jgi:hypothetical protein
VKREEGGGSGGAGSAEKAGEGAGSGHTSQTDSQPPTHPAPRRGDRQPIVIKIGSGFSKKQISAPSAIADTGVVRFWVPIVPSSCGEIHPSQKAKNPKCKKPKMQNAKIQKCKMQSLN